MSDTDTVVRLFDETRHGVEDELIASRLEALEDSDQTVRRFLIWAAGEVEENFQSTSNGELIRAYFDYGRTKGHRDPRTVLLNKAGDVRKSVADAIKYLRQGNVEAALSPFPPPAGEHFVRRGEKRK